MNNSFLLRDNVISEPAPNGSDVIVVRQRGNVKLPVFAPLLYGFILLLPAQQGHGSEQWLLQKLDTLSVDRRECFIISIGNLVAHRDDATANSMEGTAAVQPSGPVETQKERHDPPKQRDNCGTGNAGDHWWRMVLNSRSCQIAIGLGTALGLWRLWDWTTWKWYWYCKDMRERDRRNALRSNNGGEVTPEVAKAKKDGR
jgi:hypothetical protein